MPKQHIANVKGKIKKLHNKLNIAFQQHCVWN